MLRETQTIDHYECRSALEAAVLEVRLIHALKPRYNRQGTRWERAAYLRLDTSEPFPRLVVARSARGRGVVLGPLSSARGAKLAVEAVETVAPLRRCSTRLRPGGPPPRDTPCASAQLGVAYCPCAGTVGAEEYAAAVDRVVRGLTSEPSLLLDPLAERIRDLAAAERYEEAADTRDRAAALSGALRRVRRFDALRGAGRVVVTLPGGTTAELDRGVLRATWNADELPGLRGLPIDAPTPPPRGEPLPAELADELVAVAAFLDRYGSRLRLVEVEGRWASPVPTLPAFRPGTAL
jgi:DNA polymerase-3 subunit epsilon